MSKPLRSLLRRVRNEHGGLECYQVWSPEEWDNDEGPPGWWAVVRDNGIEAYAGSRELACWIADQLNDELGV